MGLVDEVVRGRHRGIKRTQRLCGVVVWRYRGDRDVFLELEVIIVILFQLS
jgi:hypothetical protein